MLNSETRPDKRTDDQLIRRERSYHAIPSDWLRLGKHEHVLNDRERLFPEQVCYEYALERDPAAVGNVAERQ